MLWAASPAEGGKVCVSGCLIVCAHAGAPSFPPSLPRSAPAPSRSCSERAREPGTPGGGRGARAARRVGRPPRAARSGKLERTAAAVCPAPPSEWRLLRSRPRAGGGGGETRRAPRPLAPALRGGRAPGARAEGGRASGAGGRRYPPPLPPGDSASDVGGSGRVWGVRGLPVSDLGRALPFRLLRALPIAVGHSRSGGQLCRPARRPVRSAASSARSGELSQLQRVAR
uniref:Uncharacterized protein n=1 Tax=Rangifer tarandus platyrhynchus TaxID=3082113 RepID=A0ACB0FHP7_RANTA|nr:unnamed protein product [Rangifer tarandus platyrhynchus]